MPTLTVPRQLRPRLRARLNVLDDSRRWDRVVPRHDDVVISTPAKSGTTWTQTIVRTLLHPDDDAPPFDAVPWVDVRVGPLDEVLATLETTTHRRAIKTHSPADAIPLHEEVRYLAVFRDARDAFTSWMNHRRGMRPEIVQFCNQQAARDGVAPWPPVWDGEVDSLLPEWVDYASPAEQLASWWPLRDLPNVLLVHFQDLLDDLDGEMRRIAAHLDVAVDEDRWPAQVDRCRFASVKAAHRASSGLAMGFDAAADRFFHRGTNGRWRDVLTSEQAERILATTEADLDPAAARWLRHGSLALGHRP